MMSIERKVQGTRGKVQGERYEVRGTRQLMKGFLLVPCTSPLLFSSLVSRPFVLVSLRAMATYLLPVFAYLLCSVSRAIVTARLFGLRDPREVGSGNPGATNILRYGGKKAAILTLLGDMLKGAVPVLLAHALGVDSVILALTMLAAFIGHVFPVFHGLQGGKGVATAFGALGAMNGWGGVALGGGWRAGAGA